MAKQKILHAIRRIAESNSGKPPGLQTFLKQTGLRPIDWQRHWIRWGDAVRDAGFEPNRLNARLSDDHLLSHLAALARELGHFPLLAEIRMKKRTTPGFPSASAFRRLGHKPSLARALAQWCQANPGWEDVREVTRQVADESAKSYAETDDADTQQPGYVYLIKSGRYHKIGRTISPKRRLNDLDTGLPHPVVQVHLIPTDDPVGIERYWHTRFAHRRKKGEWFQLTPQDIATFRRHKSM